jgi:hypothetical protein
MMSSCKGAPASESPATTFSPPLDKDAESATASDSSFGLHTPPSTPPPPPAYSTPIDATGMTVTQLLSVSIKKRRALTKQRTSMDMRRELQVTNIVSRLCEFIGEVRAKRRRHAAASANVKQVRL